MRISSESPHLYSQCGGSIILGERETYSNNENKIRENVKMKMKMKKKQKVAEAKSNQTVEHTPHQNHRNQNENILLSLVCPFSYHLFIAVSSANTKKSCVVVHIGCGKRLNRGGGIWLRQEVGPVPVQRMRVTQPGGPRER